MSHYVTISTHNGSSVSREHNLRKEYVVSKEEHIDPSGVHEVWIDEAPREAYKRIFGEALEAYNAKQTRDDRKIKDYYAHIKRDEVKHPVYEMIIGIYGLDDEGKSVCPPELGKSIMHEFVDTWSTRNPNLELIGAYYHADEQGEPHVHIDYVPIGHNYSRGLKTQNGLVKALGEMGFEIKGRETAQIQWEARENAEFDRMCTERGLEVYHPREIGRKHLETDIYKAEQTLSKAIDNAKYFEHEAEILQLQRENMELDNKRKREALKREKLENKDLQNRIKATDYHKELIESVNQHEQLNIDRERSINETIENALAEPKKEIELLKRDNHEMAQKYSELAMSYNSVFEENKELKKDLEKEKYVQKRYKKMYEVEHMANEELGKSAKKLEKALDFLSEYTIKGTNLREIFEEKLQREQEREHERYWGLDL